MNGLDKAPIRWIVDDVTKFLHREIKREVTYDGIILDPPSFGRGSQKEVFKIEEDLPELLDLCIQLLSDKPIFLILSAHTPGVTPIVLRQLLSERLPKGSVESGEMLISGKDTLDLPSGAFARWQC